MWFYEVFCGCATERCSVGANCANFPTTEQRSVAHPHEFSENQPFLMITDKTVKLQTGFKDKL